MKQTLLIILLLFLSVGFSQQEYNGNDLIEMDNGLYTVKFSDEPISGKVYGYFGEVKPYKKVYMGNIRDGKKEGKWVAYYHKSGKKVYEETYKDGEWDGLGIMWYENGQKEFEGTYKNGKMDGKYTSWHKNGQKADEGTYKDGKEEGLWTAWYENGQKELEGIFKDGEVIEASAWDEDGNMK
jgi:antitoxin component YwqK of YwqJK toxin-antitoxin module